MQLATIVDGERTAVAVVLGDGWQPVPRELGGDSMRAIAGGGPDAIHRIADWVDAQGADAWRPLDGMALGPAVPDPGAIYTVGLNYRPSADAEPESAGPVRPLIYGKAASAVAGPDDTLTWDRALTANVDPEIELGVVIGPTAWQVSPETALDHVFGYTCMNDVSSRDAWLDGDQWLLGKSMPGFCPVGPWILTPDELDPGDVALGCLLNGTPIQDGRTSWMRVDVAEIVSFLSRHVMLRPGDLIASGTPPRLPGPLGPDRHLEPGDVVTVWIDGIGELTTHIT